MNVHIDRNCDLSKALHPAWDPVLCVLERRGVRRALGGACASELPHPDRSRLGKDPHNPVPSPNTPRPAARGMKTIWIDDILFATSFLLLTTLVYIHYLNLGGREHAEEQVEAGLLPGAPPQGLQTRTRSCTPVRRGSFACLADVARVVQIACAACVARGAQAAYVARVAWYRTGWQAATETLFEMYTVDSPT